MDFEQAKSRLKIAAAAGVLLLGGWWLYARLASSPAKPKPAAGAAATPPADPADALVAAHRAAGAAKDWARQEALWAEIAASSDKEPARRRRVQDDRAEWLMRALKENDAASADRLAAAMIAGTGNDEIAPRHALKEWRSRQFEKWRAARSANNPAAASAALAAMSSWEPLDSDLPRDLVAAAEPAELMALAEAAMKDHAHASAAVLLRAVAMTRGDSRPRQAQALLDDAIMGMAADPALARPRPGGLPPSVDLLQRVGGPRRTEALNLAAMIIEARADELRGDKPELCGPLYDEALRRLSEAASRERSPLPESVASRLAGKSADARLAATLKLLDTDPEPAFAELRPMMRDGKDEARGQRALETLVEAWRKARDAKAFDRLVDLSAFMVAEAGSPPAEDPFHAEFKAGLAALAEDAKARGPGPRVFVLALLADAYPDAPEGRAARAEADARGAELVRAAARKGEPPQAVGTSGLSGRSVALIENAAARHVLVLFDGPESFAVRVDPYRRGSVVLKDGKYVVGAAVVKDGVAPDSAEASFGEVLVRRRFTGAEGGPAGPRAVTPAYGPWTILRAPAGEKYSANPMNGTVRP